MRPQEPKLLALGLKPGSWLLSGGFRVIGAGFRGLSGSAYGVRAGGSSGGSPAVQQG